MQAFFQSTWFEQNGALAGSVLLALAIAWAVLTVIGIVTASRRRGDDTFDDDRLNTLRQGNSLVRLLEPLMREVEWIVQKTMPKSLPTLQRHLSVSKEPLPWKASEFVATKWIEGVLIALITTLLGATIGFAIPAGMLGALIALGYAQLGPYTVAKNAQKRLHKFRLRLPFAVDLISLTMEAGGGFQECLGTAVDENKGHPLSEEFAEVLRQIDLGRPRREALATLAERLNDDDVNELVFAINKGEQLGTPLSAILRDQAEQMRLKRSQRGEKAAGEAQVNIVFPGMIVMIACLLVVIAPIVLPAILNFL